MEFVMQDFRIEKKIGCGKTANVFKALHVTTNTVFALKFINHGGKVKKSSKKKQQTQIRETTIHAQLKHKHIINMYGYFYSDKYMIIVLEHAPNGNMYDKLHKSTLKTFTPELTAKYTRCITEALMYCHGLDIIHGDIKLENLLLDNNGELKISDFGPSGGTLDYMSPELVRRSRARKKTLKTKSDDCWSLGVVIYEMLCQDPPFLHKTRRGTENRILTGIITFPLHVRHKAKDLISRLLNVDIEARFDITDVWKHPFCKLDLCSAIEADADNVDTKTNLIK